MVNAEFSNSCDFDNPVGVILYKLDTTYWICNKKLF